MQWSLSTTPLFKFNEQSVALEVYVLTATQIFIFEFLICILYNYTALIKKGQPHKLVLDMHNNNFKSFVSTCTYLSVVVLSWNYNHMNTIQIIMLEQNMAVADLGSLYARRNLRFHLRIRIEKN